MSQDKLRKDKAMNPSAYVQDASEWAGSLVRFERDRGHPDPVASVARHTSVPKGAVWSLIYRPPKKVAVDVYLALGALYASECAAQSARYSQERDQTQAKTRLGRALMRTANRLSGQDSGAVD